MSIVPTNSSEDCGRCQTKLAAVFEACHLCDDCYAHSIAPSFVVSEEVKLILARLQYPELHPRQRVPIRALYLVHPVRGGQAIRRNSLFLWKNKRDAWRNFFKGMDFDFILECIKTDNFEGDWEDYQSALSEIFYRTDRKWIVAVLERIKQFKQHA